MSKRPTEHPESSRPRQPSIQTSFGRRARPRFGLDFSLDFTLDDARRVNDLRRLSQHRADAAIARTGQLQRAIHRRLLDAMARKDVLDRDLDEDLRMRLGAHTACAGSLRSATPAEYTSAAAVTLSALPSRTSGAM